MTLLTDVRKKITALGSTEVDARDNHPVLEDLWNQLQDLKEEMNDAKKAAAAEAAKPYLETIEQIEKRYALFLKLSS